MRSPVDRGPPCLPCSLPRPPLQVPSKLSSSSKAETTTITIITIALINCNALSVGILTLDSIISLAASSPHPLVHLTLGQLFGRLNRWQKKSTNPQKQFCDSPERNFCRPVAASSWCEEGLNLLMEMVVVPDLTWPGDGDSPIPGTGGGDLR